MSQFIKDVYMYSNETRMQLSLDESENDKCGFDWVEMLSDFGVVTLPVSSFRHAPMSDKWSSVVCVGMKVEVENTDTRQSAKNRGQKFYWLASIISLMGYKARLRYEGYNDDDSKDFWVNIGAEDVHPVGWCAFNKKTLIPPRTIQGRYSDWRAFVVTRLTGAHSLPDKFHSRLIKAFQSRFRVGMTLELIDRHNWSTVKVATVETIIGRRLKLRYADAPANEAESFVWCHEDSTLIHPVGWAVSIGHKITASTGYLDRCSNRDFLETDAAEELFNGMNSGAGSQTGLEFKVGMKLEAVDPLNRNKICPASVVKVLKNDYIMVQIDRKPDEDEEDKDWDAFCCHVTSACIAPPGFCEANGIALEPLMHYEGDCFRWSDYLRQQKAEAAPELLFKSAATGVGSQMLAGMSVEASDLVDSHLICVATIVRVAGRLVRVHFDGWPDEYDQWMDAESPELYPLGWCELAGHRLEAPKAETLDQEAVEPVVVVKKKTKSSSQGNCKKGRRSGSKRERSPTSENHSCSASKFAKSDGKGATDRRLRSKPLFESQPAAALGGSRQIPKLVDLGTAERKEALAGVEIADWSPTDVAEFLRLNGHATHSDAFAKEKVDGPMLLSLTEDRLLQLTGLKGEASLKIFDLVSQLEPIRTNTSSR